MISTIFKSKIVQWAEKVIEFKDNLNKKHPHDNIEIHIFRNQHHFLGCKNL